MISTNLLNSKEFMVIDLKRKLSNIYLQSGIPIKYHFETLEKGWSTEFSPSQKLSGVAKEKSKLVKKIISAYIDYLDGVLNTQGLKLKFKDSYVFLTDMILDGGKESGKTFLLSLIAQAAINKGYKVKSTTENRTFLDDKGEKVQKQVHLLNIEDTSPIGKGKEAFITLIPGNNTIKIVITSPISIRKIATRVNHNFGICYTNFACIHHTIGIAIPYNFTNNIATICAKCHKCVF